MAITPIRRFKLQSTPCNRLVAASERRRNVDEQGLHAGSIFGEPDPEEAISWAQLRSRMAALINGQLLSEGEILQSQTMTVSECGGEHKDEGK